VRITPSNNAREGALQFRDQDEVLWYAAKRFLGDNEYRNLRFHETSVKTLRRDLVLYGLIEVDQDGFTRVWKLTDYGRRQLAAIAP
jgi:hypothetical protein